MNENKYLDPDERALLRKLLVQHFNSSELKIIGFDIDVDYEELPGVTKSEKAAEMIMYLERRQRFHKLVKVVTECRPMVDWPGQKSLNPENNSRYVDGNRIYGRNDLMSYWFSMTSPSIWEYSNASLILDLDRMNDGPSLLEVAEIVNIRDIWVCSFEFYSTGSGCAWPTPYTDTQVIENSWTQVDNQIIWRPPRWILPAGKCIDAKVSFKAKANVPNGTVFRVKGKRGWLDEFHDMGGQTYTIRDDEPE